MRIIINTFITQFLLLQQLGITFTFDHFLELLHQTFLELYVNQEHTLLLSHIFTHQEKKFNIYGLLIIARILIFKVLQL